MSTNVVAAVKQICHEKNIPYEVVIETIEAALAAAYRKDFGNKNQNIRVKFDPQTGDTKVYDVKTVVPDELMELGLEKVEEEGGFPIPPREMPVMAESTVEGEDGAEEVKKFNPKTDIILSEAIIIKDDAKIGDEIITELEKPADYGRMAAQTAKQVITQRLKEAERNTIFQEYKEREHIVLNGTVQRVEGRLVWVDLGRTIGLLPPEGQIGNERYRQSDRVKVYVMSVNKTSKGAEVLLSRRHPDLVKELFMTEIPEIASGVIEIKGIAREAGSRTKIAVYTEEENVDPIGSCVGQRGTRVQTIIGELAGEKIDIIEYSNNLNEYVAHSLLPAKVESVKIIESKEKGPNGETDKVAEATVASDQLSLAIGKAGQNVRLASTLTGCKINIIEARNDGTVAVVPEEVVVGAVVPVVKAVEPVVAESTIIEEKEEKTDEPKKEKKPRKKKAEAKAEAEEISE